MDFFGIGQALKGAANIYFTTARQTGRTHSLIESVKSGDRVIFRNQKEANYFKEFIVFADKDVDIRVVDPRNPRFEHLSTVQGRCYLDHGWVEDFYLNNLDFSTRCIADIEKMQSGSTVDHIETRIKASRLASFSR